MIGQVIPEGALMSSMVNGKKSPMVPASSTKKRKKKKVK